MIERLDMIRCPPLEEEPSKEELPIGARLENLLSALISPSLLPLRPSSLGKGCKLIDGNLFVPVLRAEPAP